MERGMGNWYTGAVNLRPWKVTETDDKAHEQKVGERWFAISLRQRGTGEIPKNKGYF